MNRQLEEGVYRPKIFNNVIRKGTELKEPGLLNKEMKVSNKDEMVKPLAREILMVPVARKRQQRVRGRQASSRDQGGFMEESKGEEDTD